MAHALPGAGSAACLARCRRSMEEREKVTQISSRVERGLSAQTVGCYSFQLQPFLRFTPHSARTATKWSGGLRSDQMRNYDCL